MTPKAAKTAYGPMAQVAIEQRWPESQRIVADDIAFRFLPGNLQTLVRILRLAPVYFPFMTLADRVARGVRGSLLCRKRYIDGKLREALDAGIGTVVILGAGWDDRAYRAPVSGRASVFEVDLPENMTTKSAAVSRLLGKIPAHVHFLPFDFQSQELHAELQKAGYSPRQRVFFIWEGVTQYIDEAAVRCTLSFLSAAAPGSRMVFTYILKDFIDGTNLHGMDFLYRATRNRGELWRFGLAPDSVTGLLAKYSWRELEQAGESEYQQRYIHPARRTLPVMPIERAVYCDRL